jgi:predicted metal-dependent phosphoesterase TrpH
MTIEMGKADLHIHTSEGDGVDSLEAILDHAQTETDLDVIAITEHDCLEVGLRARDLWVRDHYRFDLVPGVEVTTLDGHLVALFVEEPVPSLLRLEETIEAVQRQGGVCFVPHPMSWLTRSVGPQGFERIARAGLKLDGIELASASPTTRLYAAKARRLNDLSYGLPCVGASDAHFKEAIGSGYTSFDGDSAGDLKSAFQSRTIDGCRGPFPRLRDIGLRRALTVPLRGLAATPTRLGWRRTIWSFVSRYGK